MSKNTAQVQLKEQESKDPHIWVGLSIPLPSTEDPVMLPYREAFKALSVIGEAFRNMKLSKLEKKHFTDTVRDLVDEFTRAQQKNGGEGVPLKLSRIWPGWNDDGTRKDENAPSPKASDKMGEGPGAAKQ